MGHYIAQQENRPRPSDGRHAAITLASSEIGLRHDHIVVVAFNDVLNGGVFVAGPDDELVWWSDGLFILVEAHDNGVCTLRVVAFADEGDAVVLTESGFFFKSGAAFVVRFVSLLVLLGPRQPRLARLRPLH